MAAEVPALKVLRDSAVVNSSGSWVTLHKRGASERFAGLSFATVCLKKAPRSAPRHSLELSFGERFFATYRCIEN